MEGVSQIIDSRTNPLEEGGDDVILEEQYIFCIFILLFFFSTDINPTRKGDCRIFWSIFLVSNLEFF